MPFNCKIVWGLVFYLCNEFIINLVACPSIATYLFSDEEDLLKETARFIKKYFVKYNSRPLDKFADGIEDMVEKERMKKLLEEHDNFNRRVGISTLI